MAKDKPPVVGRSVRELLEKFAAEGDAEAAQLLRDRDRRESLATPAEVVTPTPYLPRRIRKL